MRVKVLDSLLSPFSSDVPLAILPLPAAGATPNSVPSEPPTTSSKAFISAIEEALDQATQGLFNLIEAKTYLEAAGSAARDACRGLNASMLNFGALVEVLNDAKTIDVNSELPYTVVRRHVSVSLPTLLLRRTHLPWLQLPLQVKTTIA